MARILLALLSVLIVLNLLTFLLVVNQETPAAATPGASAGGGTATLSPGTEARLQKIDRIESTVSSLKLTVDNLERKIDSLSRRAPLVSPRSPSVGPSGTATSGVARRIPTTSPRRTVPVDPSGVTESPEEIIEEGGEEVFVDEGVVEEEIVPEDAAGEVVEEGAAEEVGGESYVEPGVEGSEVIVE